MSTDSLPSATEILERLADEPDVDSQVVDATIERNHAEVATVTVESKLTVDDAQPEREEMPYSEYERFCDERTSYVSRFEGAPTSVIDKTVPFIETGRKPEMCTKCLGEGQCSCPNCEGRKVQTCPKCDGTKTYECTTCDGKGIEECPRCRGETLEACPNCDDGSTECSKCDGDPEQQCQTCGGDGDCTACGGSPARACENCGGTRTIDCDTCDGSGNTEEESQCGRCDGGTTVTCKCNGTDDDCTECGGKNIVECPRCEGTGTETEVVDCDTCGGSGYDDCPECGGSGACTVCDATGDCTDCGGDRTIRRCSNCGGIGLEDCKRCSGGGLIDCRRCHTQATIECRNCEGATECPCNQCNPDGDIPCKQCQGDGEVICPICDSDGKIVTAKRGEIEFQASEEINIETDQVRSDLIDAKRYRIEHEPHRTEHHQSLEHTVSDHEPATTDGGVYRHHVKTYEVPMRSVIYSLRGNKYGVAYVEGDGRRGADTLEYDDYPVSSNRLQNRLELDPANGHFQTPNRSLSELLAGEPRRIAGDVLTGGLAVLGSAVVLTLVEAVFSITSLWGSITMDAIGIGASVLGGSGIALAIGWSIREFWDLSDPDVAYGGLVAPAVAALAAVGVLVTDALTESLTLVVVSTVAVLWIGRVSQRLYLGGNRAKSLANKREKFLDEGLPSDADLDDLREHGLDELLPASDAWSEGLWLRRLSWRVLVLFWTPMVFYLSAAILSHIFGPPRIFRYLSFAESLAVPAIVALVSTLTLVLLRWHDPSGTDSIDSVDTQSPGRSDTSISSTSASASDLSESQFELLVAVDCTDRNHGLAISEWLEERQHEEVSSGELYSSLSTLADEGFIEQGSNGRSTMYVLTEKGRNVLMAEAERAEAVDKRKVEIHW